MQSRGRLTIFDISNGDPTGPIIGTEARNPTEMVFSLDDSYLLYYTRKKLFKRSVDEGRVWELAGLGMKSVLADDGSLFLTTGLEKAEIVSWDTHQLQEVGPRLEIHLRRPTSLAVSPNHKLVAVVGDSFLYIYDRLQGTQVGHAFKLASTMDYVSSFSPDGTQIVWINHFHNLITVASMSDRRLSRRLRVPHPCFMSVRFSGDGSQIVYIGCSVLAISDVEEDVGEPEHGSADGLGVTPTFTNVFSVNNGSIIVTSMYKADRNTLISTWAADTGKAIASTSIHGLTAFRKLSSTANQRIMLRKLGGETIIVDATSLKTVRSLHLDYSTHTLSNSGEMVAAERWRNI
jgi:hypothetical protein